MLYRKVLIGMDLFDWLKQCHAQCSGWLLPSSWSCWHTILSWPLVKTGQILSVVNSLMGDHLWGCAGRSLLEHCLWSMQRRLQVGLQLLKASKAPFFLSHGPAFPECLGASRQWCTDVPGLCQWLASRFTRASHVHDLLAAAGQMHEAYQASIHAGIPCSAHFWHGSCPAQLPPQLLRQA